jgi:hypothetical protein
MRLPRFTAEESLNVNNNYYKINGSIVNLKDRPKVLPQRQMLRCARLDDCNVACGIEDDVRGISHFLGVRNICVV